MNHTKSARRNQKLDENKMTEEQKTKVKQKEKKYIISFLRSEKLLYPQNKKRILSKGTVRIKNELLK